jgi:hypothetical protein
VQISPAGADGERIAGWVINRSNSGICLAVPQVIPLGTVLNVRSTQYADYAPWVQLEIKHCRPYDDQWLVGGKFLQPPPWNVLLLFG